MHKTWVLAIAMTSLAACGGDDDGGCVIPEGAWLITYSERSGDCDFGDYEVLVAYDGTRNGIESTPLGCTGGRALSDDQCVMTLDLTCRAEDASGAYLGDVKSTGELKFVADDRIEGVISQMVVDTSGATCTSIFDVVGEPQ